MSLRDVLVPEEPRHFPARVWVRVTCRSLHILCIGIYVGGVLFELPDDELAGWFHGAMATGSIILLTDLYASLIYLAELRGLALLAKLGLLAASFHLPDQRVAILIAIVIASSVVSHMPSRFRHFTLGTGTPSRAQRRSGRG